MAKYIDAEGLLKWTKEFYPDEKHFASAIINAPAADVAEVKHAHWSVTGLCSNCHKVAAGYLTDYCPHCGCRIVKDKKCEEK